VVTKRWAQFGDGYILGVTTDNQGIFFVEGGDDTQVATGGPALDDGKWHFSVGTYDPNDGPNGTMKLYVDGQLVGQGPTVSQTINYQGPQGLTKFCVGRGCDIGGTQRNPFFGFIDEVAVWDEVRQADDVLADFTNSLVLSAPPPLLGDANNDDQVTGGDLIAVQQNFGTVYPSDPTCDGLGLGDANDDCQVTGGDLISVQQNFGKTQNAAVVPEPLNALILLLPAVAMRRRRRPLWS
jgi:hypothetical protein